MGNSQILEDDIEFSGKRKKTECVISSEVRDDTGMENSGMCLELESNMDEEEEWEDERWTKDSLASSSCKSFVPNQQRKSYDVQNVKPFLKVTKNMKNVKVQDFFPDKKLFLLYVSSQ
ncbi:hypothetical protein XENORESO_012418 [Xenotaenia resolanae]|uniref:Uncharacterized protein n=1 Tax=Xenotaenia resolanae TaxID=208358 RepID=A0ABV0W464_9TELE